MINNKDDINIPRLRHGHKYTEYEICLSIMMVLYTKQHLNKIWSSIHENISNVNIECAGKSKQLYSLCDKLPGALIYLHFIILILMWF